MCWSRYITAQNKWREHLIITIQHRVSYTSGKSVCPVSTLTNQFHLLWCKQKRLRRQQQDNSPKRNDYRPLSSSHLSWLIFPSVLVITGVRQYLQLIQVAQIVQLRAVCCVSLHSLTVRRGTEEAREVDLLQSTPACFLTKQSHSDSVSMAWGTNILKWELCPTSCSSNSFYETAQLADPPLIPCSFHRREQLHTVHVSDCMLRSSFDTGSVMVRGGINGHTDFHISQQFPDCC